MARNLTSFGNAFKGCTNLTHTPPNTFSPIEDTLIWLTLGHAMDPESYAKLKNILICLKQIKKLNLKV